MSTRFSPPPFPQPLVSASSATGTAFYLVMSPAQGSTHPLQIPIPGRTPFPPPPTFPMPPGQANHVTPSSLPSYHWQALHSTVSELAQTAPDSRGRNPACVPSIESPCQTAVRASAAEDDNKYEVDDGGYRYPATMLTKSPPSLPFFSGTSRFRTTCPSQQQHTLGARESRLTKFFSAVFRKPRPSRRTHTPEHTVREPRLAAFRCRYPGCTDSVRSDEAARLGGFCGDTHMWRAIYEGIAQQCPRCLQRVCPEGWNFCSAWCANGQTRHNR